MITAGSHRRTIFRHSSAIHPMIRAFVYMSGAGTSTSGPIPSAIAATNPRLSRSSSIGLSRFASTRTPPFAPPYGRSSTAHFIVIQNANARTSSASTDG